MTFTQFIKAGLAPYQTHIREVLDFLFHFIKNPMQTIRRTPNWPWPQLIITFVVIAAVTGTFSGLLILKLSKIFSGLIIFPISALVGGTLLSAFFFYIFLIVYHREVPYKTIFTTVTLSLIPFFALYTLSSLIPLLQLVGFAISGILMIVGLTENTQIERKKIIKIVIGLYVVYAIMTIVSLISWERGNKSFKDLATPESYKQLEKEFEQ